MAKKLIKKIIVGFIILSVVFVFDYFLFMTKDNYENEKEEINNNNQEESLPEGDEDEILNNNQEESLPEEDEDEILNNNEDEINLKPSQKSFQLNVPFTSQSPNKKWDHLHNEACEEASLIMAYYWLNSKTLNKEIADKEIIDSVVWQEENWGGHYDLN